MQSIAATANFLNASASGPSLAALFSLGYFEDLCMSRSITRGCRAGRQSILLETVYINIQRDQ